MTALNILDIQMHFVSYIQLQMSIVGLEGQMMVTDMTTVLFQKNLFPTLWIVHMFTKHVKFE